MEMLVFYIFSFILFITYSRKTGEGNELEHTPLVGIEAGAGDVGHRIAMKQVRHDGEEAVGGEVVGQQAVVEKAVAHGVSEEEHGVLGATVGRALEVDLTCGHGISQSVVMPPAVVWSRDLYL